MIEVAFSCDYYYYCHADCSGQGLKVTCGLGALGCMGGAGRSSPPSRLGMLLGSQLLASLPLAVHSCSLDTEWSSQAHDGDAVVCCFFSSSSDPLDSQCLSPPQEPYRAVQLVEHTDDSARDSEFPGFSRVPF